MRDPERKVYCQRSVVINHSRRASPRRRTVQELFDHADVAAAIINAHVLRIGGGAERSPLYASPNGANDLYLVTTSHR